MVIAAARAVAATVSGILVCVGLVGCGAGASQCLPSPLHLTSSRVRAGGSVTLSAARSKCELPYAKGKKYSLTLGQIGRAAPLQLGAVSVHRDGKFISTVHIPETASPGIAAIIVNGSPFDDCNDEPGASCAGYTTNLKILPAH